MASAGFAHLAAGTSAQASTGEQCGPPVDCCAIFLNEISSSTAVWLLEVSCQVSTGERHVVANIITTPLRRNSGDPIPNKPGGRAIARCSMPDARVWYVRGQLARVFGDPTAEPPLAAPQDSQAKVVVSASQSNGNAQAVELLEGVLVPAQNYALGATNAAGGETVPSGAIVQQISCVAGPAGATIAVPDWVTVTVPPNTSFTLAPGTVLPNGLYEDVVVTFGGDVLSGVVAWVV